jgi:hypothetical protein
MFDVILDKLEEQITRKSKTDAVIHNWPDLDGHAKMVLVMEMATKLAMEDLAFPLRLLTNCFLTSLRSVV